MSSDIAVTKEIKETFQSQASPKYGTPQRKAINANSCASIASSNDRTKIAYVHAFSDLNSAFLEFLYQNKSPIVNQAFEFLEEKSNVKRENVSFFFYYFKII